MNNIQTSILIVLPNSYRLSILLGGQIRELSKQLSEQKKVFCTNEINQLSTAKINKHPIKKTTDLNSHYFQP